MTAGTVANLTAQSTALVTADVTNILNASTAILAPYSTTSATVTVSCLAIDAAGNGQGDVEHDQGRHGARDRIDGDDPHGARGAEHAAHLREVSYPYKPTVGYTITGTLTLSDKMYMSPRISLADL